MSRFPRISKFDRYDLTALFKAQFVSLAVGAFTATRRIGNVTPEEEKACDCGGETLHHSTFVSGLLKISGATMTLDIGRVST
jgi:hypothetical protein